MMTFQKSSPRKPGAGRLFAVMVLSAFTTLSEAAILNLSDSPIYLLASVEPNVLLTFDDSGSMARSYIPDGISGNADDKRGCSSAFNRIYFDPAITYDPPVDENGVPKNATATSYNAAYRNGFLTGAALSAAANIVDLSTNFQPSWNNAGDWTTAACGFNSATTLTNGGGGYTSPRRAFYYTYSTACGNLNDNNCYTLVQDNGAVAGATNTAWSAAQRQNFANWYSYYRNRNMMAKTAAGRAFARFAGNVRVAAQHLGHNAQEDGASNGNATGANNGATCTTATCFRYGFKNGTTVNNPVRPFTGVDRTNFFNKLYNAPASNWTPLREAMRRAGDYLTLQNPYLDNTASAHNDTTNPERSCRANLHVMMTDGYWNSPTGNLPGGGAAGTIIGTNADNGLLPTLTPPSSTTFPVDQSVPQQNTTVTTYTPQAPYSDGWTGTLADAAFYYWITDLRQTGQCTTDGSTRGCTNNVASRLNNRTGAYSSYFWDPVNDPATWQHMSTYTIGLGIPGTLVNNTATYNALRNGTACTRADGSTISPCVWPDPIANAADERIDDLWHAAINSRGRYFSAQNPSDLVNAFTEIVSDVNDRISAASSVAMDSGTLTANNFVYQARFNSGDWSGQLLAYPIDPATGLLNTAQWDAAVRLSGQNYDTQRQILTYKPSTGGGAPFRWASLDASQQALLNYNTMTAATDTQGPARLNWIRGDASNEGTGFNFRVRQRLCGLTPCPAGTNTGWLGDIIDSGPVYIGPSQFTYPDSLEASPYTAYKNSKTNRTPMLYVGANDGMLHGFNASTGNEVMAYVPGEVYSNLSGLTASVYAHKYFVNGSQTIVDAYASGQWRTILAGTLRKGGQSVYALDVSTPELLTEGNSNAVLWEFNDSHDPDLGYVYGDAAIARMHNGKWAVIFGNGYNNTDPAAPPISATGNAVLYIVFIEDGMDGNWSATDFVKIDTGEGSSTDPLGLSRPNGLGAPAIVDVDGDYIVDYIYAGDLRGTMWRFDVRSTTATNWTNPANRLNVFQSGTTKPITSRPVVGNHPAGLTGLMIYFGTGKYLESTDASTVGASTQTFYGVWDNLGGGTVSAASLRTQTVDYESGNYRVVSDNPVDWNVHRGWRLDLPTAGERVVANPMLFSGIILFVTVIPSDDPCASGGTGWLMELNANNGGQLPTSPFDVNGDGIIDSADLIALPGGSSGVAGGVRFSGIPSMPAIVSGGNPYGASANACGGGNDCKYVNTSDGGTPQVVFEEKPDVPMPWRQVR